MREIQNGDRKIDFSFCAKRSGVRSAHRVVSLRCKISMRSGQPQSAKPAVSTL
jgi:hypothetical protein